MKISLSLFTAMLLLASITLGGGAPGAPEDPQVIAIKNLVEEYARCCRQEDLAALARIYAKGPDTVQISAVGAVVTGWKAIEDGFRNFFQNVDGCKMQFAIHAIKILADGKAACLTAEQEATMRVNNREVTFQDVRMTWFLEKQDGHWRIVNAHWSIAQRP